MLQIYHNFIWLLLIETCLQLVLQWNLSKQNFLGTNFCVQNIPAFSLYRLNKEIFTTFGLYLNFGLYRVPVYSGFGLDRFIQGSFLFRVWFTRVALYFTIYDKIKDRCSEWVRNCCFTSNDKFFSKIMARTRYFLRKWWWSLVYNRSTSRVGF